MVYGLPGEFESKQDDGKIESLSSLSEKVSKMKEATSKEELLKRQIERARAVAEQVKKLKDKGVETRKIKNVVNQAHKVQKRKDKAMRNKFARASAKLLHKTVLAGGPGKEHFTSKLVINDYPEYARSYYTRPCLQEVQEKNILLQNWLS